VRLHPEHIEKLFPEVSVGTDVQIVYEPVKVGVLNDEIYIEVHPDTDGMTSDLEKHALEYLQELGEGCYISDDILHKALQDKNGMPTRIGYIQRGGDGEVFHAAQINEAPPMEVIN
jgi:L,D-transpeptidase ErfK/SrfK